MIGVSAVFVGFFLVSTLVGLLFYKLVSRQMLNARELRNRAQAAVNEAAAGGTDRSEVAPALRMELEYAQHRVFMLQKRGRLVGMNLLASGSLFAILIGYGLVWASDVGEARAEQSALWIDSVVRHGCTRHCSIYSTATNRIVGYPIVTTEDAVLVQTRNGLARIALEDLTLITPVGPTTREGNGHAE